MSEPILPPAPSPPPAAPSSLPPKAGKSHLGLILGGVVVLFLVFRMFSGSSSSSSPAPDGGAPAATDGSAPVATAASVPAATGGNTPISTDDIFALPGTDGSAPATATAASVPVAPARSAPVATASSDNPLIGSWALVDTDKNYCATHEVFKKDSMIEVKDGATNTLTALYLMKPGYVDVTEDGDMIHYHQFDETAADEITLRINSLYVVASCKYHRD
jgi:hypothetical protein